MPRHTRKTPEERYAYAMRHETADLENFVSDASLFAEVLVQHYKQSGGEISEAEYRAAAFFINGEYKTKPDALVLLYNAHSKLLRELPASTKETVWKLQAYTFKVYGELLMNEEQQ
jgi:hypothetical protein